MRETAGLLISAGWRLAAVIEASRKSTATPLGGVSPIDKVIGTPLAVMDERFVEPLQASSSTQLTNATAKKKKFLMAEPPHNWNYVPIELGECGTYWSSPHGLITQEAKSVKFRTHVNTGFPADLMPRDNLVVTNAIRGVSGDSGILGSRKFLTSEASVFTSRLLYTSRPGA
jgi:hypothetical protein